MLKQASVVAPTSLAHRAGVGSQMTFRWVEALSSWSLEALVGAPDIHLGGGNLSLFSKPWARLVYFQLYSSVLFLLLFFYAITSGRIISVCVIVDSIINFEIDALTL